VRLTFCLASDGLPGWRGPAMATEKDHWGKVVPWSYTSACVPYPCHQDIISLLSNVSPEKHSPVFHQPPTISTPPLRVQPIPPPHDRVYATPHQSVRRVRTCSPTIPSLLSAVSVFQLRICTPELTDLPGTSSLPFTLRCRYRDICLLTLTARPHLLRTHHPPSNTKHSGPAPEGRQSGYTRRFRACGCNDQCLVCKSK